MNHSGAEKLTGESELVERYHPSAASVHFGEPRGKLEASAGASQ